MRRHVLPLLRQALYVGFVDDCAFPGYSRLPRAASRREGRVDHGGFGHPARIVSPVERQILARASGAIAEMGIAPHQPARNPTRIGIEQQLVAIEAMTVLGLVRAVNPVAIELTGRDVIEVTMPDILAALGQCDTLEFAPPLIVEQTKLHLPRVG